MPLDATVSMLTDSDYATNVAFVAGGYVAGALAQNLVEGAAGMDLPNELYGIASIAASTYLSGDSMRYMAAAVGCTPPTPSHSASA